MLKQNGTEGTAGGLSAGRLTNRDGLETLYADLFFSAVSCVSQGMDPPSMAVLMVRLSLYSEGKDRQVEVFRPFAPVTNGLPPPEAIIIICS